MGNRVSLAGEVTRKTGNREARRKAAKVAKKNCHNELRIENDFRPLHLRFQIADFKLEIFDSRLT